MLLSNDESRLYSASSDETVRIWETDSRKAVRTLKGHKGSVYIVDESQDSKWLFSGGYDNMIVQWELANGTVHRKFRRFQTYLTAMAFSDDHRVLYSINSADCGSIR